MPKTESFDITTGVDLQEVDNALNQARKEITNRYDFKGVTAEIDYDRTTPRITLHTADDYKLEAIWQVLEQRFRSRNVPLKNMVRGKVDQASGGTVQTIYLPILVVGDHARTHSDDFSVERFRDVHDLGRGRLGCENQYPVRIEAVVERPFCRDA